MRYLLYFYVVITALLMALAYHDGQDVTQIFKSELGNIFFVGAIFTLAICESIRSLKE